MTTRITPEEIRKTNKKQIYDFIYNEGKVSQNDIVTSLRLSRPTVALNVTELEEDGLIFRNGQQDSVQIGRKAVAYSVVSDYRISIGVELTRRHAKIIAVDLYGNKVGRKVYDIKFENKESYYKAVTEHIREFTASLNIPDEKVLGVGIAMQGLVSPDGNVVLYGRIMDCTGASIDLISKHLPFKCTFVHDPEGAARSELWASPELTDAVYLSLSEHLGGAMIVNRSIQRGKSGHSATFEHIQFKPRGELCYCGKRGCFETVLSMHALLGDRDPDDFFAAVRSPGSAESIRWHAYLKSLAILIEDLHLVNDVDYILGGHLAPYFTEEDINVLYDEIGKLCPFDENRDYILISKMPSHNINIGAALPFIEDFLSDADSLLPE